MTTPPITITADTIRPLTLDDYAAERAAMVDALRSCGASGVYEIGSVGVPGIAMASPRGTSRRNWRPRQACSG